MISLLRKAEYEEISKLTLNGSILDLGGSRKSKYQELIHGENTFSVVNIDSNYGFDLNFDLEEPFPLEDESYDHALAINTVEHIYNYQGMLKETYRVLRPNGKLIISIPFLIPIHGCPRDFNRFTGDALSKILEDQGFHIEKIVPLAEGLLPTLYQLTHGLIPTSFLKYLYQYIFVGLDTLFRTVSKRYKNIEKNHPLGYFIIAKK